jgi:hypothetical protein
MVELIAALEDAFQISMEDQEAADAATVGDLYRLVLGQLKGRETKRCLNKMASFRTRRAIADVLGVNRREIQPATQLAEILPQKGRREKWRQIQAALGLKLPALRHPTWIRMGMVVVGVEMVVLPGVYREVSNTAMALLFFLGCLIGYLLAWLTPGLAVKFPYHVQTVGELARHVLALNRARLVEEVAGWNEDDIWEALCQVIARQVGIAPEKITAGVGLTDDLGRP